MSIVTLVSGGLDSTLMAVLTREDGIDQYPLFIDYGQLNRDRELQACLGNFRRHGLPEPRVASLPGYGALLSSGLTDASKDIYQDAFLPCRNLMFLVLGSAYAFQVGASAVCIGLLNEAFSLFPDQRNDFLIEAQALVTKALGRSIGIKAPLMTFTKAEVVAIAKTRDVNKTYSCHAGVDPPCGVCVACREYDGLEV